MTTKQDSDEAKVQAEVGKAVSLEELIESVPEGGLDLSDEDKKWLYGVCGKEI